MYDKSKYQDSVGDGVEDDRSLKGATLSRHILLHWVMSRFLTMTTTTNTKATITTATATTTAIVLKTTKTAAPTKILLPNGRTHSIQ